MFKFNTQGIPDSRQCPVDGVKEVVATCIILRSDPFSFHYSPQGFRKVQVRGIRWKVKEKKSAFLPQFSQFPYFLVSMYARIVKYDKGIFLYVQGKGVKVFNDLVRVNTFSRGEPMIAVVPVYHAEDVDPLCLWGWDIHVFVTELPAVRHIAFGAHMAFIGVIEVYLAVYVQMFKFLQLLGLIRIELRRGYSPWAFSYSLISCAKADKKTLECQVARFLASGLLPGFPSFADALSVLFYGLANNFLVRTVHDRFSLTAGTGLQAVDAFRQETFYPRVDRYM